MCLCFSFVSIIEIPLVIAHWVFPLMENVDRKKKKLILGQWKRPGVGQGPNSKLQADKKDADQYIRLSETEGKRGRTLIPIMPPNLRTLVAKCRGGMDSLLRFSSSTASNAPEIKTLLLAEITNPNLFTCAGLGYGCYTTWQLIQLYEYRRTLWRNMVEEVLDAWSSQTKN